MGVMGLEIFVESDGKAAELDFGEGGCSMVYNAGVDSVSGEGRVRWTYAGTIFTTDMRVSEGVSSFVSLLNIKQSRRSFITTPIDVKRWFDVMLHMLASFINSGSGSRNSC